MFAINSARIRNARVMKIIIVKDYDEMSQKAAGIVAEQIAVKPDSVIGFATGSTPIGLYKILIKKYENGEISFKKVTTVNLDEYVGLDKNHKQSYNYFMNYNLFDHIDVDKNNVNIPNGRPNGLYAECVRYMDKLESLQQDIQILGIGSNGHIGFNEPGTRFKSVTHVVELSESTISDNSRLFDDISEVPKMAITMGISEIMNAKHILVLANGDNKAEAVYKMIKGEISEACPASVLQNHPNCTVIIDEKAAKLL